jgi:UDPglucose 6-dehydrogenase
MKIGVIGVGVVGGAVYHVLKDTFKDDVFGYDKVGDFSSEKHFKNVLSSDIVFVCVPSPTVSGKQDLSHIEDVMRRLKESKYSGIVVLKSTVLPGTTGVLRYKYSLNIIHNPEFLTAANPITDFIEQKTVLLGGPEHLCIPVANLYGRVLPDINVIFTECIVTETAKYLRNNYLAVKVSLANEYHNFCKKAGIDYNEVKRAMLSQGGVEKGHWNVPGPDGNVGYSGMCLPKDIRAMVSFLSGLGLSCSTLKGAEVSNQSRRPHDEFCKECDLLKGDKDEI